LSESVGATDTGQENLLNPHNPSVRCVPSLAAVQSPATSDYGCTDWFMYGADDSGDAASLEGDFNHALRFSGRRPLVVDRELALEP
jgi:hypothetical protein